MIEMVVDRVAMHSASGQPVVLLKEKSGPKYLFIFIDPFTAQSILMAIQGQKSPRPLTHDLMINVLDALGVRMLSLWITDLANDTFYAILRFDYWGAVIDADARPSDGIALALRTGAPIFAEEKVLEQAGITLDQSALSPQDEVGEAVTPVSEEEAKALEPFRRAIEDIDLEGPKDPKEKS